MTYPTVGPYTILAATINAKYVPVLELHIAGYKSATAPSFVYEERNGYYFAEQNGLVRTIFKPNPDYPDSGFGGMPMTVLMNDGTIRSWVGGWDTGSQECEKQGFPPFVHVTAKDPEFPFQTSLAILTSKAQEILKHFDLPWEYRDQKLTAISS